MHQSIRFLDPTFVPLQADLALDEQVAPDLHLLQLFLFLELVIHNQLNKSKIPLHFMRVFNFASLQVFNFASLTGSTQKSILWKIN